MVDIERPVAPNAEGAGVLFSPEFLPRFSEISNPSLYLINTRVWLRQQSDAAGRELRLIDIPQQTWDQIAREHDGIWFMGIYEPSEAGRIHALGNLEQYRKGLPDLTQDDIVASPFALSSYELNPRIAANWTEWDELRRRLNQRGLVVFGDVIPNHVALDHPWTVLKPGNLVEIPAPPDGKTPAGFYRCILPDGSVHYYAHGKDPNFAPWLDTLQLNYTSPELQQDMIDRLVILAEHFDGVRADMAMLLDPGTFYRTWGWVIGGQPWPGDFWPRAIAAAKERAQELGKQFVVWGEAYWDKKELLRSGQERVYAKDLYDQLVLVMKGQMHARDSAFVEKLYACADRHAVVFTENHDEHRAVEVFGGKQQAKAAFALLAFLGDSALMVHHGQEFGYGKKLPMQVGIPITEEADGELAVWHRVLLEMRRQPLFRGGKWKLEETRPSGRSDDNYDRVVAQHWVMREQHALVCVNTYNQEASAHVPVPEDAVGVRILDAETMEYLDTNSIASPNGNGLYINLKPYHSQIVFYNAPKAA